MNRKEFAKNLEKRTRKFAVKIHKHRQEKIINFKYFNFRHFSSF